MFVYKIKKVISCDLLKIKTLLQSHPTWILVSDWSVPARILNTEFLLAVTSKSCLLIGLLFTLHAFVLIQGAPIKEVPIIEIGTELKFN